jgi:hypothetical protein
MSIVVQLPAVGHRRQSNPLPVSLHVNPSTNSGRRSLAVSAPLDCLAGRALASRFHAWRGSSGSRYVCSVFPVRGDAELGGLPEFDAAVALAVSIGRDGERSRVAVFELCWRNGRFVGDVNCVKGALAAGVCEWHIHLLAETGRARRAMINDLEV